MSFAAKIHWSPPEKRRQSRYKFAIGLTLHEADGTAIDVEVENVSLTGIGLRSRHALPVGTRAWLGIPGMGNHQIEIVRRDGDMYGCKLDAPLSFLNVREDKADDAVVFGRFAPRPEAFLHDAVLLDVAVDTWSRTTRTAMAIGIPAALWLALFGIWLLAR